MLSVKINGSFVKMFPGTKIKYQYNSPAFSEKALVGDFSFNLSFPVEGNEVVFGFLHRQDIFVEEWQPEIQVYLDSILLIDGVYKINKTTDNQVTGNIINPAYHFINVIKNKTTKDLDLGGTHTYPPTGYTLTNYCYDLREGGYPTYKFAYFPILNESLFDGTGAADDWATKLYINRHYGGTNENVYFPYLAYLLDQIFKTYDYNLTNNAIANDSDLVKLVLVNIYKDPTMFDLYEQQAYNLLEHVLPCSLTKLMELLNGMFATSFFFDYRQRNVKMLFKKDILSSSEYIDWSNKIVGRKQKENEHIESGWYLQYEWDGDDAISTYQLEDGILDNITLEDPVNTPDDLPTYDPMFTHNGEVRFVICMNAYYIIKKVQSDPYVYDWVFFCWGFFGLKVGDALKEHPSKMLTMGMYYHSSKRSEMTSYALMTPYSNITLCKDERGMLGTASYQNLVPQYVNEIEPRLMFYRGMRKDAGNIDYPLGTSGKHDMDGNVIGTYTLDWDGDTGLYKSFWEEWLNVTDKEKPFKFFVKLSLVDLLSLDLSKKIKINSTFFLIKNIIIDFPISGPATVEMVKI